MSYPIGKTMDQRNKEIIILSTSSKDTKKQKSRALRDLPWTCPLCQCVAGISDLMICSLFTQIIHEAGNHQEVIVMNDATYQFGGITNKNKEMTQVEESIDLTEEDEVVVEEKDVTIVRIIVCLILMHHVTCVIHVCHESVYHVYVVCHV